MKPINKIFISFLTIICYIFLTTYVAGLMNAQDDIIVLFATIVFVLVTMALLYGNYKLWYKQIKNLIK